MVLMQPKKRLRGSRLYTWTWIFCPVQRFFPTRRKERYRHDIFIANIGDQALTGIKAELSEHAQNIALDEYWTVRESSLATLAAFDSTYSYEMDNIAKIRYGESHRCDASESERYG